MTLFERVRGALDFRPPPSAEEADATTARVYADPRVLAVYERTAGDGLTEVETEIAERWFRPGGRLLDVGCGCGREAFVFARRGHEVVAIDVSPESLACAARAASSMGLAVRFERASLREVDRVAGTFDVIFLSSDVYASIPGSTNRRAAIEACRRKLAPGGVIALAAGAREPRLRSRLVDGSRVLLRAVGARCAEPGDRWVPATGLRPRVWVHRHAFTRAELEAELSSFEIVGRLSSFVVSSAKGDQPSSQSWAGASRASSSSPEGSVVS